MAIYFKKSPNFEYSNSYDDDKDFMNYMKHIENSLKQEYGDQKIKRQESYAIKWVKFIIDNKKYNGEYNEELNNISEKLYNTKLFKDNMDYIENCYVDDYYSPDIEISLKGGLTLENFLYNPKLI